ncbi:hypothetical protein SERLADRAFT_385676 [Serpula lacrymans var. lacrymans S7.9]|uniref:Uncharacterized protein n=1 Tax=Serpula lacrymans var. lacrymans (strain S7.9) TaxID=578457 RepID=F8NR50_SERL9|nr:uncharacterized protein SERLADRAFT_385676 [Serpula lacrymans var. lacrymans S7.9]EGO26699.1 hypothetical protein SERLADRAFT_385676 [Serpula lacrymans var. lacrymans S7.9]
MLISLLYSNITVPGTSSFLPSVPAFAGTATYHRKRDVCILLFVVSRAAATTLISFHIKPRICCAVSQWNESGTLKNF